MLKHILIHVHVLYTCTSYDLYISRSISSREAAREHCHIIYTAKFKHGGRYTKIVVSLYGLYVTWRMQNAIKTAMTQPTCTVYTRSLLRFAERFIRGSSTPRRRTASVAFCKTVSPSAKRSRAVRKKYQRQRASPLSLRAKRLLLNQLCPSHQETSEANIVPTGKTVLMRCRDHVECTDQARSDFRKPYKCHSRL